jgi:hypothetical protein
VRASFIRPGQDAGQGSRAYSPFWSKRRFFGDHHAAISDGIIPGTGMQYSIVRAGPHPTLEGSRFRVADYMATRLIVPDAPLRAARWRGELR